MRLSTLRLLLTLCLTASLAPTGLATAAAQPAAKPVPPDDPTVVQEAAEAAGAFFESVDVDILNVDFYVTDRQGNPVKGLTIDDFELFEDKRPVKITNFYSIEDTAPRATLPIYQPPVPAGTPPPSLLQTEEEQPEDQRLYLVVYIDNLNIQPFNRNRTFARLRTFLSESVRPGDQVMLVTYNRSRKERVAFTSDPGLINSTLREIEKETGGGTHFQSDRNGILKQIEDAEQVQEVIGFVRSYAGSLYNDIDFSIDALKETVGSLGGLPGRKAILYVSEGLPMRAAEDIFEALRQKFQDTQGLGLASTEYDFSRRLTELTAQANARRVTFYTIDAGGLRTLSSASAERQTAGAPGSAALVDSSHIHNVQASLRMIAEETGGKAIINTNDVGPQLATVASDFRTYYSLGYQPAKVGDGRYHRLEVKVKGEKEKKLQVRHRTGYRDRTVDDRMSDATMASLRYGGLANPLGITLAFGTPSHRDDGLATVPLHLSIPLDKVTLVPQADQQVARLRAFIGVIDEKGGEAQETRPIPITIPTADLATAKGKSFVWDFTLVMRRGYQEVAVGIRDEVAGVSSFARSDIVVR